ncbi:hypothetical protein [Shewanella mangrovi]|uniref:hypothetical protein n=1 Tax=Shewanella mangrovi TaxID=1515746 RepID=UPI0012DFF340|nr:hypothetical protein [Shewanella mangrovi]
MNSSGMVPDTTGLMATSHHQLSVNLISPDSYFTTAVQRSLPSEYGRKTMSKEHKNSKEQKKQPQHTAKEKRALKAAKKQAKFAPVENIKAGK